MATTKRSKKGRATSSRAIKAARGRATKAAKSAPKRKTATRAMASAKTSARTKPVAKPKVAAPSTKRAAAEPREVTALKAKFQRERNALERNLTEAVREIGVLRHHELRAMQLERQLADRDAIITRLQTQLSDLERRPAEPVYVREVQQSLALGGSPHDTEAADLDEFEDERLPDDADLVSDEE